MEIQEQLKEIIKHAVKALYMEVPDFALEYPAEMSHGDFAANIALIVGKKSEKNPREMAEKIKNEIEKSKPDFVSKIEVAGPGFINFYLSREFFADNVKEILKAGEKFGQNRSLKGKKILVEYTDPNPFKEFHIGHLMSNAIGESIARLYETQGANVKRMCYQGDVGPHVAKTLWSIWNLGNKDREKDFSDWVNNPKKTSREIVFFLATHYVIGSLKYEVDQNAKKEIDEVNKKIYEKSDAEINKLYEWGLQASLKYLDKIYQTLGTKFDYIVLESQVVDAGKRLVQEFLKRELFEGSEKAIVFHAEKYNPKLHTRVFITSQGLPTYETKELGLTEKKFREIKPDISIVVTANEQNAYFDVFLEALEHIDVQWAEKTKHISHGMMRFAQGKMSSRTGNVYSGESLIIDMEKMVEEKIAERDFKEKEAKEISEIVAVGAIKYSILRQAIASDIIFDAEKSVSFEGDSGPYLQYAVVRAKSVIEKAKKEGIKPNVKNPDEKIADFERKLTRFPAIAVRAADTRAPHILVSYLIDLSSDFNSYYAQTKIIDTNDHHSSYRIALASAFATVVENGLNILGIKVPEKM